MALRLRLCPCLDGGLEEQGRNWRETRRMLGTITRGEDTPGSRRERRPDRVHREVVAVMRELRIDLAHRHRNT